MTDWKKKITRADIAFAAIAVITFALLAYLSKTKPWIVSEYLARAADVGANLADGRGYVTDSLADYLVADAKPGSPESVIPLGMPTVHALFFLFLGRSEFTAKLPAIFFFIATVIAVYAIGRKRFGAPAGLVAAALTATDFVFLTIAMNGLYFTALAFFLLLAVEFVARGFERGGWKNFLAAGLFAGAAFHFKLGAIVFGGLIFVIIVGHSIVKREWLKQKPAAFFLLGMAILVGPWILRNTIHFDSFIYPRTTSRYAYMQKNPKKASIYQPLLEFQPMFVNDQTPNLRTMIANRGRKAFFIKSPIKRVKGVFKQFLKFKVLSVGIVIFGVIGVALIAAGSSKAFSVAILTIPAGMAILVGVGVHRVSEVQCLAPFLALPSGYLAVEFFERLKRDGTSKIAWAFAVFLFLLFAQTSYLGWRIILKSAPQAELRQAMLNLSSWLGQNTKSDDVFVSRMPAHIAFYSKRRAIPTPPSNFEEIRSAAKSRGSRYLIIEFGKQVAEALEQPRKRGGENLDWTGLMKGEPMFGAEKVYDDGGTFAVYKLPENAPVPTGVVQ